MRLTSLVLLVIAALATSSYHSVAFLELKEDQYPVDKVLDLIPENDLRELCQSLGKTFNMKDIEAFCSSAKEKLIRSIIEVIDKNNAIDKVFDFLASVPERLLNVEVLKGIFAIDIPKSKKLIYAADAFVRKLFDQEEDEVTLKSEIDSLENVDKIKEKIEEQAMNYMIIVLAKEGKNVRDEDLDYLLNLKNYISLAVDTVFYHDGKVLNQKDLQAHLAKLSQEDLDAYYYKAKKLSVEIMGNDEKADHSSNLNYIVSQASVLPILASPEFIRRVEN